MTVTHEEIARLAALARIPLTAAESDALRADLERILSHVRTLDALAHRSAQPFAGTGPACARPRDDHGPSDAMLLPPDALAPEWEDGFFVVPRLASHSPPHVRTPPPSAAGAAVDWEPYVDGGVAPVPDGFHPPADPGASAAHAADGAPSGDPQPWRMPDAPGGEGAG